MRTTIALLGLGLAATVVVISACLIVLRQDLIGLQRELGSSHQAARPSAITCPDISHLRLRVHGAAVHCTSR